MECFGASTSMITLCSWQFGCLFVNIHFGLRIRPVRPVLSQAKFTHQLCFGVHLGSVNRSFFSSCLRVQETKKEEEEGEDGLSKLLVEKICIANGICSARRVTGCLRSWLSFPVTLTRRVWNCNAKWVSTEWLLWIMGRVRNGKWGITLTVAAFPVRSQICC